MIDHLVLGKQNAALTLAAIPAAALVSGWSAPVKWSTNWDRNVPF